MRRRATQDLSPSPTATHGRLSREGDPSHDYSRRCRHHDFSERDDDVVRNGRYQNSKYEPERRRERRQEPDPWSRRERSPGRATEPWSRIERSPGRATEPWSRRERSPGRAPEPWSRGERNAGRERSPDIRGEHNLDLRRRTRDYSSRKDSDEEPCKGNSSRDVPCTAPRDDSKEQLTGGTGPREEDRKRREYEAKSDWQVLEALERQRKREVIREARLERARLKHRRPRVTERDISEKIALGQAAPTHQETLFDARLYNRDDYTGPQVIDPEESEYRIYDVSLFNPAKGSGLYHYDAERIKQNVPDYEP